MTSTAPERDTSPGVYAVAVLALGHHMHTHRLPLPHTVAFPIFTSDVEPLTIYVSSEGHQEWLASVECDDIARDVDAGEGKVMSTWQVFLPATGHHLVLKAIRKIPFGHGPTVLSAVTR